PAAFLISRWVVYFRSAYSGVDTIAMITAAANKFFTQSSETYSVASAFARSASARPRRSFGVGGRSFATVARGCERKAIMALPRIRPGHLVKLGAKAVELFSQNRVALDRVTADLLIRAGRHPRQVCDVCLQSGLAIADRLAKQPLGN